MPYTLFADESGTSVDEPCYAIGALMVPDEALGAFSVTFRRLVERHGVTGEVRWNKVSKGHGLINLGIDLLKLILDSDLCFNSIVVKKRPYRKWRGGAKEKEEAFYTTYTLLLTHCAKYASDRYAVYIDHRANSYAKYDETVELIANRMLAQVSSRAKLTSVTKADSHLYPGIQAADFLTGAIKASHHRYLDSKCPIAHGKVVALGRLAAVLGWKALHFDTMPNHRFNIWHFPTRYRNTPSTRQVRPDFSVPYVVADDLEGEDVQGV